MLQGKGPRAVCTHGPTRIMSPSLHGFCCVSASLQEHLMFAPTTRRINALHDLGSCNSVHLKPGFCQKSSTPFKIVPTTGRIDAKKWLSVLPKSSMHSCKVFFAWPCIDILFATWWPSLLKYPAVVPGAIAVRPFALHASKKVE